MTVDKSEWLDPLNRMIWQRAFRLKLTETTLRDGRKFTIKYVDGKDREGKPIVKAWIRPVAGQGFAPCGWFVVKDCLDPLWLKETTAAEREVSKSNVVAT